MHVKFRGLLGTYDDGLAWLKTNRNMGKPRLVISLGSSLGNFTRSKAADFLKGFSDILGSRDAVLIGLDACQDKDRVYHAYNDKEGKTREFYMNGLDHANTLIGKEAFKKGEWEAIGEYDDEAQRHQAFYIAITDVVVEEVSIRAGEKILFEESYKYSKIQSNNLWHEVGLAAKAIFRNDGDDYRKFSP